MFARIVFGGLMLALAGSVAAAPVLSCAEVDEVGEALTGLGIALDDENAQIGEGSPEDQALQDVVIGLAHIADAEEDEDLAVASIGMAEAWADNDREMFLDALADAVAKLAVISVNECE